MISNELSKQEGDINTQASKYIELFNQSNWWITDSHIKRVKNMLTQVLNHKDWEKLELLAYNNKNIFKVVLELFKRTTTDKVSEIIWDFDDMNTKISWNTNIVWVKKNSKVDDKVIDNEWISNIKNNFIEPLCARLLEIQTKIEEYKTKLKIYFDYSTFINRFKRWFKNITRLTSDLTRNETVSKTYLENSIKRIEENEVNIINSAKTPFQYYLSYLNKKIKEVFNDKIDLWSWKFNNEIVELNNTGIYNFLFTNSIQTSKDLLNFEKWIIKIREILNNQTNTNKSSIIILDENYENQLNDNGTIKIV